MRTDFARLRCITKLHLNTVNISAVDFLLRWLFFTIGITANDETTNIIIHPGFHCCASGKCCWFGQVNESVDKDKISEPVDQEKLKAAVSSGGIDYKQAADSVDLGS